MRRLSDWLAPLLLAACSGGASAWVEPTMRVDEGAARTLEPLDHGAFTDLLAEHVRGDRVNYRRLAQDRGRLRAYLDRLEAVTPERLAGWSRDERFAFWIDAYNAYTLDLVLEHYPLESIRDIGGELVGSVWERRFVPLGRLAPELGRQRLSLDDIEHEILRRRFPDARLHAAINCASVSCPPLRAEAYVGERLERQLEEQMRAFVADPTRNQLLREQDAARVSAVFDWFAEDFERDAGSVRAYLARYAPGEDTAWLADARLETLDYDWTLNDVR